MKKQNKLNALVNSMSMSEKRYFKVFSEKNILGSQNKYLVLFDAIAAYNSDDDDLLKNHLSQQGFNAEFLSADKNYLYNLILRCLNDYHNGKTLNLSIKEALASIEILFHKGLYADALKLIDKAERQAIECENYALVLDVLNWKKKCVGYSYGVVKAQEINNLMNIYLQKLNTLMQITDLYYQSYYLRFTEEKSELPEVIHKLEEILRHPLIENGIGDLPLAGKIFYNLIFAHYYYIINDVPKEYETLRHIIALASQSSWYSSENPIDYVSIYNRLLPLRKFIEPRSFYDDIRHLREFAQEVNIQKDLIQQRVFIHTHTNELEFLFFQRELPKALDVVLQAEKGIQALSMPLEPVYLVQLYNLFAIIYLFAGRHDQALHYVNLVLNQYKKETPPGTYARVEIINLLIHFELSNYYLVGALAKGLLKKQKENNFYPVERSLITLVSDLSRMPIAPEVTVKSLFKALADEARQSMTDIRPTFIEEVYIRWLTRS